MLPLRMQSRPPYFLRLGALTTALVFALTSCDKIESSATRAQEGLSELVDNLRNKTEEYEGETHLTGNGSPGTIVSVKSETELEAELSHPSKIVVVSFTSPTCPACDYFEPILHTIINRDSRITLVKIDVSTAPDLARAHNVRSIPDTRLMVANKQRDHIIGAVPLDDAWAKFSPLLKELSASADSSQKDGEDGPAQPQPSIEPTPENWMPEGITPAGSN